MSYRAYVALMLAAAAISGFILWNVLATTFIGVSIASLLVGLRQKRVVTTLFSGWLLYLPLAATLARFFPAYWSYLMSGLLMVVVPERLTFEYEVSSVLGSPTGVDAEARSLASRLSRAHWRKTAVYAALVAIVLAAASVESGFTSYASELITATVLLMLVIIIYARR